MESASLIMGFVGWRRSCVALAIVMFLAAWAVRCEAAINFYRVGKRVTYLQTDDNQPSAPAYFDAGADMAADNPADLTSARVFSTSPTLLSPASPFHLTEFSSGYWGTGQLYASLEDIDVALPPGDIFGFLIEGGDLGNRLALLPLPTTNLFAQDAPYFTGNAFSQLNGVDPTESITLTWNNFVPAAGVNEAPVFFGIYRVSDGQFMIGSGLPTSQTSFAIPASTLQPGTQYKASLDFSSRKNTFDAGFIDADASALYDLVTELQFTTGTEAGSAGSLIPEPASVVVMGCALVIFCARTRRRSYVASLFLAMTAVHWAAHAEAAISFYRVGKTIVHQQTSDTQPGAPSVFYGGVDMLATAPADIGSARVFSTRTMPPSPVSEFVLTEFSPGFWGSSQAYSSLAEMDASLPPGDTFGFLIEAGDLGDQLALIDLPATNLFSLTVPFFTGNTFSQLNGLDPTQSATLTWNSFVPAAGINEAPIFISIYRVSDGQQAIGSGLPTSQTSFVIPANTLQPGTQYKAFLDFSSRMNTFDAGFTDADASRLFDSVTELMFTTSAGVLPGDYNRNGDVDAADYVVWRKTLGQTNVPPYSGADGDGDGDILQADFDVWQTHFGSTSAGSAALTSAVPEPASGFLALCGLVVAANRRSWRGTV